jgi:sugar lactone lactonase YvrE
MEMSEGVRCVVPGSDVLGETPLWCEQTQSVLWLDIEEARVQRFHPASGRHDVFQFDERHVGSLALLRRPGRVLLGLDLALVTFDLGTGRRELVCQVEPAGGADNRLNDGRCDSRGRFWVGTMDNQLHRGNGSVYRVDPDGSVHRQFGDVIVANTIAMSPNEDTLYFSDTRRYTTWRFGLDLASGTLGERKVFVDHTAVRDRPDGACVDAEGYVWNAIFGGKRVVRYAPDGRIDRVIQLPVSNPTCVCFGGPDLRTLYITTARRFLTRQQLRDEPWSGSLLAFEVEVAGLPERRFGRD